MNKQVKWPGQAKNLAVTVKESPGSETKSVSTLVKKVTLLLRHSEIASAAIVVIIAMDCCKDGGNLKSGKQGIT